MPRTSFVARANELGLSEEYKALQRLRHGDGLTGLGRLLEIGPRVRSALGISDPPAPADLDLAVEALTQFLLLQPEQDRILGVTAWNIRDEERLPTPIHSDGEEWLDRCKSAAKGSTLEWTEESSIRRQTDRLTFNLMVHLLSHATPPRFTDEPTTPSTLTELRVTSSPREYKDLILSVEASASRIDRLPKRISTIFKDDASVREIAEKRFGPGSPNIDHYLVEHQQRRDIIRSGLDTGLVIREIYNWSELMTYCRTRIHGASVSIDNRSLLKTAANWVELLEQCDNYHVGITDDPIPFKYEVIDGKMVLLHEAIGRSDSHRLNAICLSSAFAAERFLEDFEVVWERIPPESRDRHLVAGRIKSELVSEIKKGG